LKWSKSKRICQTLKEQVDLYNFILYIVLQWKYFRYVNIVEHFSTFRSPILLICSFFVKLSTWSLSTSVLLLEIRNSSWSTTTSYYWCRYYNNFTIFNFLDIFLCHHQLNNLFHLFNLTPKNHVKPTHNQQPSAQATYYKTKPNKIIINISGRNFFFFTNIKCYIYSIASIYINYLSAKLIYTFLYIIFYPIS
jgi:hypothetical protein